MNRVSIHWKIIGLTLFIIFCSFLLAGIFVIGNILETKEAELRDRSMLMARTVAELPEVKQHVSEGKTASALINPVVEQVRVINKAEYIVVLDMNRIRLSHPVADMLGTKSRTADEGAAFAEHTYFSNAKGEAGTVVRAFVPVMNHHKQIGVVIAGYSLPTVWEVLWGIKNEILLTTLFSLLFGSWGSYALAKHMKKQMLGLEPHEIAKLYVERTETFNAMHEGIIAIDNHLQVTIFNTKAKIILGVHEQDVIGKNIYDVLPDTRLPEIIDFNQPIYNKELQVNQHNILSNRIPIKVNQETVGAVAVFQDRTEVKKLAEELTGVKAFVQALRIQNHEHKNKLHTIAGLLQLGHDQQALEYLLQVKEEQEELTKFLSERIKDDSLAGLLLSKIRHGKELGIHVEIDRQSQFITFPEGLDKHDFVIILGNLIENAFDAVQAVDHDSKEVYISIDQNEDTLSILVEDNGIGMQEDTIKSIFERGFSTKGAKDRGIGLFLIHEIVYKNGGNIEVVSSIGKGTSFVITF